MRTATSIPRIDADEHGLKHKELTERLIGVLFDIGNELGHGSMESAYEQAFAVVLAESGIFFFERQIAIPVWFRRIQIGEYRADLLLNFGPSAQFRRYVFENLRKNPRNPRRRRSCPGDADE